jgi:hypothetical protein
MEKSKTPIDTLHQQGHNKVTATPAILKLLRPLHLLYIYPVPQHTRNELIETKILRNSDFA